MSEKSKWFRPGIAHLPDPITSVYEVSEDEARELVETLGRIRGGTSATRAYNVFSRLVRMKPVERLSHNLKAFIDLLSKDNVSSVISDGLTKGERDALIAVHTNPGLYHLGEIAQALLNVYERYQLLAALGKIYRQERVKTWLVE